MKHVLLQQGLAKPSVICSVSQDVLLYADDETPTTFHITMNFAGVTIHGNAVKCISYPSAGTTLQLAAVSRWSRGYNFQEKPRFAHPVT